MLFDSWATNCGIYCIFLNVKRQKYNFNKYINLVFIHFKPFYKDTFMDFIFSLVY